MKIVPGSILDCESLEGALTSLSRLLGLKCKELKATLLAYSMEEFESDCAPFVPNPRAILWDRIVGPRTSQPIPATIYWFHATRVKPGSDFSEGILPLNIMYPRLKLMLEEMAGRPIQIGSNPDDRQLKLKLSDSAHWRPHAFLIRDAIVRRDNGIHDYLALPEIVQDYASSVNAPWLIGAFQSATRPCIVKFRSIEPRDDVAGVALFYCHSALWGDYSSQNALGFYFDGKAVPGDDIISVEFLDER